MACMAPLCDFWILSLASHVLPLEVWQLTTRDRVFSVVIPYLWNALPHEACQAPMLLSLMSYAKMFLFTHLVSSLIFCHHFNKVFHSEKLVSYLIVSFFYSLFGCFMLGFN